MFEIELIKCIKMDLALNSHKTNAIKSNHTLKYIHTYVDDDCHVFTDDYCKIKKKNPDW